MTEILIVTHGKLANELLAAAEVIAGELPNFHALSLDWSLGIDPARERIAAAVGGLAGRDGILILTDMFGDTPSNAALSLRREGEVEVVSGVNLPMVVRLACARGPSRSLADTARWLEIKGRRSIRRGPAGSDPRPGPDRK